MKKLSAILVVFSVLCTVLCACAVKQPEIQPEETISFTSVTETTSEPTTAAPVPVTVKAEDGFETDGYVHFVCSESSRYVFDTQNSDGVEWSVFILDDAFPESEKYIKNNYTADLKGAGSLNIEAGQYIYIYCSVNSGTATEPNTEAVYTFTQDII